MHYLSLEKVEFCCKDALTSYSGWEKKRSRTIVAILICKSLLYMGIRWEVDGTERDISKETGLCSLWSVNFNVVPWHLLPASGWRLSLCLHINNKCSRGQRIPKAHKALTISLDKWIIPYLGENQNGNCKSFLFNRCINNDINSKCNDKSNTAINTSNNNNYQWTLTFQMP